MLPPNKSAIIIDNDTAVLCELIFKADIIDPKDVAYIVKRDGGFPVATKICHEDEGEVGYMIFLTYKNSADTVINQLFIDLGKNIILYLDKTRKEELKIDEDYCTKLILH